MVPALVSDGPRTLPPYRSITVPDRPVLQNTVGLLPGMAIEIEGTRIAYLGHGKHRCGWARAFTSETRNAKPETLMCIAAISKSKGQPGEHHSSYAVPAKTGRLGAWNRVTRLLQRSGFSRRFWRAGRCLAVADLLVKWKRRIIDENNRRTCAFRDHPVASSARWPWPGSCRWTTQALTSLPKGPAPRRKSSSAGIPVTRRGWTVFDPRPGAALDYAKGLREAAGVMHLNYA